MLLLSKRYIVTSLLLCLLLSGCARREYIAYQSDELIISRAGAEIRVVEVQENRVHVYATRKVRRRKNAPAPMRKILDDNGITITEAAGVLIITVPGKEPVYIKW